MTERTRALARAGRLQAGLADHAVYAPGASPDRLSAVWWARGPALDPAPLFAVRPDGTATTLVAVWPTDGRGALIADRVGEVRVLAWELTPALCAALDGHGQLWPLGAYDLLVSLRDGWVDLTPRRGSLWARALAASTGRARQTVARVEREVALLAPALLGGSCDSGRDPLSMALGGSAR